MNKWPRYIFLYKYAVIVNILLPMLIIDISIITSFILHFNADTQLSVLYA